MKLYLASQSPRRKEILSILDIPFEQLDFSFDERAFENTWRQNNACLNKSLLSSALAQGKAQAAYEDRLAANETDFLILAADTIVVLDNVVFGKGENREQSIAMLENLSGRTHQVITAVSILDYQGLGETISEKTDVRFAKLSRSEIETYVDSNQPFDKAGAYGIQEKAALFVEGINGDYLNVVGLPLRATYLLLERYISKLQ